MRTRAVQAQAIRRPCPRVREALLRNVTSLTQFGDSKCAWKTSGVFEEVEDTPCRNWVDSVLNVVFVQDSSKMCNYVMRLYHRGLQGGGKFKFGEEHDVFGHVANEFRTSLRRDARTISLNYTRFGTIKSVSRRESRKK